MKVSIIGGGWAGLAAALTLHDAGHQVDLHEASDTLGGRARSVNRPGFTSTLDNGQHILLGAYRDTLQLMRRLGQDPDALFLRMPLALKSADQRFELRCRQLSAPWHAAVGVLLARGWTLSEKFGLMRAILKLRQKSWVVMPDQTVAQWLQHNQQAPKVIKQFWEPLCLAALNTPLNDASANMLGRVLGDSLDAGRDASDVLIPRTDLSDLWAQHLPDSISVHYGDVIRRVTQHGQGYVLNDTHPCDALIVATPPASAQRLLASLEQTSSSTALTDVLKSFIPVPIATLTLELETPWITLPEPMLMLDDGMDPGALGQWLFNHAFIATRPERQQLITLVISDCRALMTLERDSAIAQLMRQVMTQTAPFGNMPKVLRSSLIIEKRATFAATPGLSRPTHITPWPRLMIAGDWTDTGYPAVLEGAVRSGIRAAKALL